jgi:membrane-associated protein
VPLPTLRLNADPLDDVRPLASLEGSVAMDDAWSLFEKVLALCGKLFSSQELMNALADPSFTVAFFVVVTLVVFVETGLLVGFCLPGDSLLVTTGLVFYQLIQYHGVPAWSLPLLFGVVAAAAVLGDTVGYWIGYITGPGIFSREKSLLFAKDHLLKAQAFYDKHGGKTIILARFMPILRTFAPVVAGVGRMAYRKFLFYNVFGGIGWVGSMLLLGYSLTPVLDPLLRPIFGAGVRVQDHVEQVIVLVVLLSIAPGLVAWVRGTLRGGPNPETIRAGTGE